MTTLTITNTTISKLGGPGSCADAIVENSDVSYTANVASGATLVVPDSNISVNAVLQGQAVSVKPVNIQLTNGVTTVTPTSVSLVGNTVNIQVPAAVSRSTAKLMKTGQTISYATNDDGNLQAGRNTSFTVLAENNPFGNTNRFTSTTGNQTYTNRITIDWSTYDGSTVLGWKMDQIPATAGLSWAQSITSATSAFGGFATGWRLPNIAEMFSIINFSTIGNLPNNIGGGQQLWTSTTVSNNTGNAWIFNGSFLINRNKNDNSNLNHVAVRTFTVTGTTLS